MKKLIIILIAAISFSAASAQSRNDGHYTQDRRQVSQSNSRNYDNTNRSNDYAYNNDNQWKNGRDRQNDYDGMNKRYDQKADGYRNDRSGGANERDRRIRKDEQERQQQSKSLTKGAIIGGVAGFLLGVLISH